MSESHYPELTKSEILAALSRLNELLEGEGKTGELCLFGGTVMVLVFDTRISTRDVDAVFQPATLIRELARQVGEEQGLPGSWLNDGVKGFQAENPSVTLEGVPQFSYLRIYRPTAEYLLAMKCLASRAGQGGESVDREDILALVRHLHLHTADEVLAIVEAFYPPNRILPKTQFMVHEVIAALLKEN